MKGCRDSGREAINMCCEWIFYYKSATFIYNGICIALCQFSVNRIELQHSETLNF